MGKRELLLIVGFLMVGAVVYQATAPPPGPNETGFSLSRILEMARREVRGNRSSAELTTTATLPAADVTEIRVLGWLAELQIAGEDRQDIVTSLRVRSNGYDDAEAQKYAKETRLETDRAGSSLILRVKYPEGRHSGRQWGYLSVRVPANARVRLEGIGQVAVSGVAGVEMLGSRGEATIKKVSGRVQMNHRGGSVEIADAEAVKLVARGTDIKLSGVRGDTSIQLEGGGELAASSLAGAIDVESRNADVKLSKLDAARGPIRVNIHDASATLDGVKADTRIDGRNSAIEVTMSGAAPIAIYSDGEHVTLTPPANGFRLDAVVVDGRLGPDSRLAELGLERAANQDDQESRASGPVKGGGPMITIRTTRGDFTLR